MRGATISSGPVRGFFIGLIGVGLAGDLAGWASQINQHLQGETGMKVKKLSAGDTVESRCTKCRAIMNHTIVAMQGEQVVRVECNTCRGTHNYYPEKKAKAPAAGGSAKKAAPAARKPKVDPVAVEREEWESLSMTMDPATAVPYDMNGTFRVKRLVAHPAFGLGVVKLLINPNKMEVLFQSGKKLLRCA